MMSAHKHVIFMRKRPLVSAPGPFGTLSRRGRDEFVARRMACKCGIAAARGPSAVPISQPHPSTLEQELEEGRLPVFTSAAATGAQARLPMDAGAPASCCRACILAAWACRDPSGREAEFDGIRMARSRGRANFAARHQCKRHRTERYMRASEILGSWGSAGTYIFRSVQLQCRMRVLNISGINLNGE
jgi:hypothetical protein